MTNARRDRLQLTVSEPMRVALEVLVQRTGLPLSAQASMILRQALDRTIHTPEVQGRLARHRAHRTHAEWASETMTDHAIEEAYHHAAQATTDAQEAAASSADPTGTVQ